MKLESVFLMVFLIILVATSSTALGVKRVEASGTVYIRSDGSIDPTDAPISTYDNATYTLTGNITSEAGGIVVERDSIIVDGQGYTVQGTGSGTGIALSGRNNVTIKNMEITTFSMGMWFNSSSNGTISGNDVVANSHDGIKLESCLDINIVNNDITDNDLAGIWLFFSTSGLVSQNRITRTHTAGIILDMSSNNTIIENDLRENRANILFEYSVNGGVALSSQNRIFHNNFINGTWNAITHFSGQPENFWNDSYPSGGNYWSDYAGIDVYSGPYQNESGSDGMGDMPYVVDASNADPYPLMKPFPWSEHDIGITYIGRIYSFELVVLPLKTIVGLRLSLNISTFVMNYGNQTETFKVQIYANDILLGAFANVMLTSRQSAILNLHWATTGFAYGNYTVRAAADNLAGETDISDNVCTGGIVYVGIPGDVNGDGKVDMKDIAYVAVRFGRNPKDTDWSSNADLDDDGKINMFDLGLAARHFMEHYP